MKTKLGFTALALLLLSGTSLLAQTGTAGGAVGGTATANGANGGAAGMGVGTANAGGPTGVVPNGANPAMPNTGSAMPNQVPGRTAFGANANANTGVGVAAQPGLSTSPGTSRSMAQPNMSGPMSTVPGTTVNNGTRTRTGFQSSTSPNAQLPTPNVGTTGVGTPGITNQTSGLAVPNSDTNSGLGSVNGQLTQTPANQTVNRNPAANEGWRMVNQRGRWWYWSPQNYWMSYDGANWSRYNQPVAVPFNSSSSGATAPMNQPQTNPCMNE